MDKNDLKSMWRDAHYSNSEINFFKVNIEEAMRLKHSKVISKTLLDVKSKVLLNTLIFFIYVGLMIYALLYLKLNLSINSLVPLALAGIFLLITATSEFVRLLVLTKTADNFSLKESLLVFSKKLNRIKTTDFIIYLVSFYLSAILILFNYLKDIGGVKNFSLDTDIVPAPLLGILILMLLTVPWFIKYLNSKRYKKLFSNLMDSVHQLNDQSDTIGC
jgi:hypothetical protein